MGRLQHPVIKEYFHRGEKLKDNSNRYVHSCKLCGEVFRKGRSESLRKHLTKKCTMISPQQRVDAALRFADIDPQRPIQSRQRQPRQQAQMQELQQQQQQQQQQQYPQHQPQQQMQEQAHNGMSPLDLELLQSQQNWTRLEALAEVSRRMDRDDREFIEEDGQTQHHLDGPDPMPEMILSNPSSVGPPQPHGSGTLVHEQFTFSSPQSQAPHDHTQLQTQDKPVTADFGNSGKSEEPERGPVETPVSAIENPTLSVATAATARLNTGALLDPTLFESYDSNTDENLRQELARALGEASVDPTTPPPPTHTPTPIPQFLPSDAGGERQSSAPLNTPPAFSAPQAAAEVPSAASNPQTHVQQLDQAIPPSLPEFPRESPQLPWGQYTFGTNVTAPTISSDVSPMLGEPSRSVFRVDQNGTKGRHARSRFSEPRRKEVQNIRKIGACIRCRILRKTCSEGDPCETCRKVLSPRIWRSGCVRTKFTDKVDLFNARIHEHHRKAQVDICKTKWNTKYPIVVLEATHSDVGITLACEALLGTEVGEIYDPTLTRNYQSVFPKVVMIDPHDDLPDRMQQYVNEVMPELVGKERSAFSRITLEAALELANRGHRPERNLKLALELWTCVEIIERELEWKFSAQPSPTVRHALSGPITREAEDEVYKTLGLQLTAAAEQRAELTAKDLLKHMQRDLQDGRAVIDEHIFFAILVLLISVEKATWAFKIWEQISLQQAWPLTTQQPNYFIGQGDEIAELLRMLLNIRKAMPKVEVRESDGTLVVEDPESIYSSYFERINLKADDVIERRQDPPFTPINSRTLELHFCSVILLPEDLQPSPEQDQEQDQDQPLDETTAQDATLEAVAAPPASEHSAHHSPQPYTQAISSPAVTHQESPQVELATPQMTQAEAAAASYTFVI
ncbi:hypothetical protein BD289DRAFT_479397 [Coniella lustricola]|uniref:Uncharacterized protein n=1 Tax=Coniella lustricola TaxID=2025994 RepID=A0A2T3AJI1_9PEZI|nr:hypothetical protein BD289DRAFT_479397 [Coniella lustricola]